MPTIKLTQLSVHRLKPPAEGRIEYWDSQLPGFGLRISAPNRKGEARKSWQVIYRIGGKQIRETLGTSAQFPNVAAARQRARQSLQQVSSGIHPVEAKRRQQRETAARGTTVAVVIARYLAEHALLRMKPDTYKEVSRALRVDVIPAIGEVALDALTRAEIRAKVIGPIVERGCASQAWHVLAYTRMAMQWAVDEEMILVNPAVGIPDPDKRKPEDRERDRFLTDDEIKAFWAACDSAGAFASLFRLLLLFGCRRDELAHATWEEFDLERREWTLPRARSKNGKAHTTHLADLAIEILGELRELSPGRSGFLFTTNGTTPVSGFGYALRRVRAEMPDVPRFTLHDLRRSLASGMADLGIPESILDRCLNHTGRKVSGTARIYNRHEYLKERQAALERWSAHIAALIRPAASNVVVLAG
jgi:integrase